MDAHSKHTGGRSGNSHSCSPEPEMQDGVRPFQPILPSTGYLRLKDIIGDKKAKPPIPAIIPVSSSTWWAGVRSGRFPKSTRKLGARITAWSVESIRELIEQTAAES